tara:strand:- start:42 stop:485 length:444 start_codon:yes stop_codon:yes gene_type:complete
MAYDKSQQEEEEASVKILITEEQVVSSYKAMLYNKTCKDIAFSGNGLRRGLGLSLHNKEELASATCFSSATYLKGNCRKMKARAEGVPDREFHLISVNLTEDEPMDAMAWHLFGFLVEGFVLAFDTKKQRDKFASTLQMEETPLCLR